MITGTLARRTTGRTVDDKRVRRDVQKDQVDIRLAKRVPGRQRLLRAVDHAEIDDLDAGPAPAAARPARHNR